MIYNLNWAKEKFDKGETLKCVFFWGHSDKSNKEVGKFVFSQWYPAGFSVDGVFYKTAEHWMMAQEAALFSDTQLFTEIINAKKPGHAKEFGRRVSKFDEIKWNEHKYEIVITGNIHKFHQHQKLRDYLLATGDRIIVEASPVDNIWGIGVTEDATCINNPHTWRGENLLGFALMEVRDFLRDFGNFEYVMSNMLPPWKKYPHNNALDTFWSVGIGKDYKMEFGIFFKNLTDREKKIYQLSYPASGTWVEFYQH